MRSGADGTWRAALRLGALPPLAEYIIDESSGALSETGGLALNARILASSTPASENRCCASCRLYSSLAGEPMAAADCIVVCGSWFSLRVMWKCAMSRSSAERFGMYRSPCGREGEVRERSTD